MQHEGAGLSKALLPSIQFLPVRAKQEVLVHGIPAADVSLAELEELAQRPSLGCGPNALSL